MDIQLLRHATLVLTYPTHRLLVDPMLSPKEATPAAPASPNPRRQPTVDLPIRPTALEGLLASISAVLLTHLHPDHWDPEAQRRISPDLPVICQPQDAERLETAGFRAVRPVEEQVTLGRLSISRVPARHGLGSIGDAMGAVSGYVLESHSEPVVYLAGDTVWCAEVEATLRRFQPDVAVFNAGAARMIDGGPVTMTSEDICAAAGAAPDMRVIAVHMEAADLCTLSRAQLKRLLQEAGLLERVYLPADGERLTFTRSSPERSGGTPRPTLAPRE